MLVVLFVMVKEGVEDLNSYRKDCEVNRSRTSIFNPISRQFESYQWKDIKVGDLIKVCKNEIFPADLLFLSGNKGVCYVDTKSLDGETNLKEKWVHSDLRDIDESYFLQLEGSLAVDQPNDKIVQFSGQIVLNNQIYELK